MLGGVPGFFSMMHIETKVRKTIDIFSVFVFIFLGKLGTPAIEAQFRANGAQFARVGALLIFACQMWRYSGLSQ